MDAQTEPENNLALLNFNFVLHTRHMWVIWHKPIDMSQKYFGFKWIIISLSKNCMCTLKIFRLQQCRWTKKCRSEKTLSVNHSNLWGTTSLTIKNSTSNFSLPLSPLSVCAAIYKNAANLKAIIYGLQAYTDTALPTYGPMDHLDLGFQVGRRSCSHSLTRPTPMNAFAWTLQTKDSN